MNKHFFKTSELPILATIALLIKLAALIDAPSGQIQVPAYRLDTKDYAWAGLDNISLYVLDYGYLITQTGFSENSPSYIFISDDSPEVQYYNTSALDYRHKMEGTETIVTAASSPANFNIAGLYVTYGPDCP